MMQKVTTIEFYALLRLPMGEADQAMRKLLYNDLVLNQERVTHVDGRDL
jgi:hypothetical protein